MKKKEINKKNLNKIILAVINIFLFGFIYFTLDWLVNNILFSVGLLLGLLLGGVIYEKMLNDLK